MNHFWQTWKSEYLAALREKQRATLNRKDSTTNRLPRVGDVVQIADATSRGCWRLGRFTHLHESRDKAIRSADILLANKNVIHRPLSALYPLESQLTADQVSTNPQPAVENQTDTQAVEDQPLRRSTRMAARQANQRLVQLSPSLY